MHLHEECGDDEMGVLLLTQTMLLLMTDRDRERSRNKREPIVPWIWYILCLAYTWDLWLLYMTFCWSLDIICAFVAGKLRLFAISYFWTPFWLFCFFLTLQLCFRTPFARFKQHRAKKHSIGLKKNLCVMNSFK